MTNSITIDVQGFKKVLDMVKGVVPSKAALPILLDVKLDWDKAAGMFYLSASNGDQYISVECAERRAGEDGIEVEPCVHMLKEDSKEGWQPVCLGYTALREAFSLLPAARRCVVTIENKEGGSPLMTIDYQDGKLSMPFDSALDFPEPPAVVTADSEAGQRRKQLLADIENMVAAQGEEAEGLASLRAEANGIPAPQCRFEAGAQLLLTTVRDAKICTADDELRPVMSAVALDCYIDKIVVAASDGHILYKNVLETPGYLQQIGFPIDKSTILLLPKQAMPSIVAAFSHAVRLTVIADSQRMTFQTEGVTLTTRCIDGKYPNYESVIPRDNPYKVQMSRSTLKMALKRVQLSANSSSNMATLSSDGTAFIVEANDYDFSRSGSERVPIQQTDAFLPAGFTVGMKISSTLELLDLLDEDSICLYFSDPSRAFLLKNESPKAQSKTLLQMPMLVNGDGASAEA